MTERSNEQFYDDDVKALVNGAYDAAGPSQQAQERMLANLLAYQHKVDGDAHAGEGELRPSGSVVVPSVGEDSVNGNREGGPKADGAGASAGEGQADAPRARIVRPWKILVPAAAVLAVLGIGVLAVSGMFGGNASLSTTGTIAKEQVAQYVSEDYTSEGVADQADNAGAARINQEEADGTNAELELGVGSAAPDEDAAAGSTAAGSANAMSAPAAAYDSAQAEADGGSESLEAEGATEAASLSEAEKAERAKEVAVEEGSAAGTPRPEEYPKVELSDGTVLTVEDRKVNRSDAGALLEEAVAFSADGSAQTACSVFLSTSDPGVYYVAYEGTSVLYPAITKSA